MWRSGGEDKEHAEAHGWMWRSGGEEEEEKEGEGMARERVIAADIAHAEAHVMWIRQRAGFVGVGSPFFTEISSVSLSKLSITASPLLSERAVPVP